MKRESIKIDNAAYVITLDPSRRIIRDGAILISGNRIEQIGKASELRAVGAERVIDASDMVVTPGFCNCHIHLSYAHAVRGLFPDYLDRTEYVESVFRLQAAMTEEEEHFTSLLAITELVKYGTTCILDPGSTKFLDACLEAYDKSGCRFVIGKQVLDKPTSVMLPITSTDAAIRIIEETITKYDGLLEGRIRAWAMPFSSRVASRELLSAAKVLADRYNTGMTLHQNFSPLVVENYIQAFGRRPVELLEDWGILGPNVLLSHLTGVNEREVNCIARTSTTGAICPGAAMKLGIGLGKEGMIPEMLDLGVSMGLGTDAGNASNLIETMRAMYLMAVIFKDGRQRTDIIPAEKALEMATIDGAAAMGMHKEVGSIEVGKKADLVLFDSQRPEWRSLFNPVNNLVYSVDGRSVEIVIVDGRIIVEDQKPVFVDEMELIKKVQKIGEGLLKRTGVSLSSRWPIV